MSEARRDRSQIHERRCKLLADVLIPPIRHRAYKLGYAIGVHGSLAYDIDLIAAPWARHACSAQELAAAVQKVAEAVNGSAIQADKEGAANPDYFEQGCPGKKPHGRLCWSFHLGGGPYIDLSVMPRELEKEA